MYKEYRDVSLNGAVSQLYQEMASRHRASIDSLHIISTQVIADKDLKRVRNQTYADKSVKFPKVVNIIRAPSKSLRTDFKANRPSTFHK